MAVSSSLVKVSAASTWEGGVKTRNVIRNFPEFYMDEPEQLGGTDTAPNPMEYVVAALNGCKGVMIPMIAGELNFSFTGIRFETSGYIDPRGLMGEEGVSPHFKKVKFNVYIQTDETDERLEQLKSQVEKRCPVFNLLKDAGVDLEVQWHKE
ncbi:MAG: OsmC family protein [Bacillaceae bacterium]|nr:OsmC family protein [Bacillaceae bacterium]